MKVSVIIPTYNRKDLLKRSVEAVLSQNFPKKEYEIIVVDDGSTDGTEELIKEMQKKYKNLRYIKQQNKGPAAARNTGIKHAKGEIIAFTDDDTIADKNWLKEIIKPFKDPEVVVVEGKVISSEKPKSFFQTFNPRLDDEKLSGYAFMTCNTAYRKSVLDKIGLFDESFGYLGEDTDLGLRAIRVGKSAYVPKAVVDHPPIFRGYAFFFKVGSFCLNNILLIYKNFFSLNNNKFRIKMLFTAGMYFVCFFLDTFLIMLSLFFLFNNNLFFSILSIILLFADKIVSFSYILLILSLPLFYVNKYLSFITFSLFIIYVIGCYFYDHRLPRFLIKNIGIDLNLKDFFMFALIRTVTNLLFPFLFVYEVILYFFGKR